MHRCIHLLPRDDPIPLRLGMGKFAPDLIKLSPPYHRKLTQSSLRNYNIPSFKPMCSRREVRSTPNQSRSCSPQWESDRINRHDGTQENWSNTPPRLCSFWSTPRGSLPLLQAYPFPICIPNDARPPLKLGLLWFQWIPNPQQPYDIPTQTSFPSESTLSSETSS